MPYPGITFATKHNKKLRKRPAIARKAGKQATAMENAGVPPGIAIATANKRANKLLKLKRVKV